MIEISIQNSHEKFFHDAVHYEDNNYLIQTGGVFTTHRREVLDSLAKFLIREYESKGETFVNELRGSFLIYIICRKVDPYFLYGQ